MNDELTGTLVLVHQAPNLHASKQGCIGMITADDIQQDLVYVSFGMGEHHFYPTDALLVLKRSNMIYADMMRNTLKIEVDDFKEIFRISMLLDSGLTKNKRRAIEIARTNEVIRSYSMILLSETSDVRQMRKLELFEQLNTEMAY